MTDLSELSDDALREALRQHGSKSALAQALGVSRSALRRNLERRGIGGTSPAPRRNGRPTLTREHVHAAMLPPNNCRVKAFRDTLDEETQDAFDYALVQDKRDLTAAGVRDMLIKAGFREAEVPGVDAINSHRRGEKPCRCKG